MREGGRGGTEGEGGRALGAVVVLVCVLCLLEPRRATSAQEMFCLAQTYANVCILTLNPKPQTCSFALEKSIAYQHC